MKRLTAQRPILYGGRMYQAGDTLPAYDKRMVQAWLSAESAKMTDDAAEEATMPPRYRVLPNLFYRNNSSKVIVSAKTLKHHRFSIISRACFDYVRVKNPPAHHFVSHFPILHFLFLLCPLR